MSTSFRLASFNVNGIRARLSSLLSWLRGQPPDVICLQETKVQDGEFPREALEDLGKAERNGYRDADFLKLVEKKAAQKKQK